jgi:cytochrome c-type biogenesis protein
MLDVSFGGAILYGLLSFVSPCVLPIVPPYLAFLAGMSFDEMRAADARSAAARRIIVAAVAFVLGFTTVFVALGATASFIGQFIARYFDVLSIVAGVVIAVMGLHFLGVLRIGLLYREARVDVARKPVGMVGAYVMGLAFAFGWTPCVGPVLAAILMVAGSQESILHGGALLAAYSLGIGIPFILAAAFAGRFVTWSAGMRRHMRSVEIVIGLILVVTGGLFMTGQMGAIANWLLETFPVFGNLG